MTIVRQRDANLVPIVWQASHMIGYALTAVMAMACSIMFYLAVAESNHRCYIYNDVLIVQEESRENNQTLLSDETVWYRNSNCYDPFTFLLRLFVSSVVWMILFLIFGRGGSSISEENDHRKYFSDMVGQWHVVFFALCFNFWYFLQTIIISSRFTNGYLIFVATLSYASTDNYFRNQFERFEKLYYIKTIVLFWCQSFLCTFNFLLTIYRCAMGVDFEVDLNSDNNDEQDDAMIAGPSNQTKATIVCSPWFCTETSH
ncbi:uncharacterized protein LOC112601228 [Melanaphis sacchari]|uniref:uncharacterized protein LOC112601228 n=1 Tax=Melanaphis sacchari TaxID=742174 RepID=UPI000DC149AE|nr:uncharacterized protein LOC112601228 [Melanaphis sacchari]